MPVKIASVCLLRWWMRFLVIKYTWHEQVCLQMPDLGIIALQVQSWGKSSWNTNGSCILRSLSGSGWSFECHVPRPRETDIIKVATGRKAQNDRIADSLWVKFNQVACSDLCFNKLLAAISVSTSCLQRSLFQQALKQPWPFDHFFCLLLIWTWWRHHWYW